MSLDLLPSRMTVSPTRAAWFGPAFATGGEFSVVSVTEFGALLTLPSLTMSCATYVPAMSTTKVGKTAAGSESVAALPRGLLVSDQE